MDGFPVSEGLQKLASRCRFSRAMPSVYGDVFERYRQLYGLPPVIEQSVIEQKDKIWAGDAADEISELDFSMLRSRSMPENPDASILGLILECQSEIRQTLKDWRKPDWVIYPLDVLVMVILVARLCGCVTHDEVVSFCRNATLSCTRLSTGCRGLSTGSPP